MNSPSRVDSRTSGSHFWGAGGPFPPPPASPDGKRSRFGAHLRGSIGFVPDLSDGVRNFLPSSVFELLKKWENQAKECSNGQAEFRRSEFRQSEFRRPEFRPEQAPTGPGAFASSVGGVKIEEVGTEDPRSMRKAEAAFARVGELAVEATANLEQVVRILKQHGRINSEGTFVANIPLSSQARRQLGQMAGNAERAAKTMLDELGHVSLARNPGASLLRRKAESLRSNAFRLGERLRQTKPPEPAASASASSFVSTPPDETTRISEIASQTRAAAQKLEQMVGDGAPAGTIDAVASQVAELTDRLRKGLASPTPGRAESSTGSSTVSDGVDGDEAEIAHQSAVEAQDISSACKQAQATAESDPASKHYEVSEPEDEPTSEANGTRPAHVPESPNISSASRPTTAAGSGFSATEGGAARGQFHAAPNPTVQPSFWSTIRNMMNGGPAGFGGAGGQDPWSTGHSNEAGRSTWLRDLLFPAARVVDYLQRNSLHHNAWMEGHVPTAFRPSGRFEPMVRL